MQWRWRLHTLLGPEEFARFIYNRRNLGTNLTLAHSKELKIIPIYKPERLRAAKEACISNDLTAALWWQQPRG